jgi:hypothetical protein
MNERLSISGRIHLPSSRCARPAVARRALAIGATAVALWAAPAVGEPGRLRSEEACATALKTAKAHEQEGTLQEAKELLASCAQAPCSTFVRQQCAIHYTKLESDMPTVVLLVTERSGAPRSDVQVRVDGTLLTSHLDGRALPINPGMHDFSFSTNGRVFATQKILIVQGQRNRFITALIGGAGGGAIDDESNGPPIDYQPPARAKATRSGGDSAKTAPRKPVATANAAGAPARAPADDLEGSEFGTMPPSPADGAAPRSGKHPLLPWVIGGVGVASLGAGALLTYWGRKDNNLLGQCAPGCDPGAPRHIRGLYRDADIAFGVGVVALSAAYWVYAVSHSSAGETPPANTALRFDVAPVRAGGLASVSGAF